MPQDTQQVTETTTDTGDVQQKTTRVDNPEADQTHNLNVFARIVWFIAGILIALLGLRFLLSLLGANQSNAFANFIYTTSHPFVAPFFNLFNYTSYRNGVSHFEVYTLFAILIYGLIAWGIVRLITITQD
jgi:hypothetical protein